jgi:hypothetical protein
VALSDMRGEASARREDGLSDKYHQRGSQKYSKVYTNPLGSPDNAGCAASTAHVVSI